MDVKVGIFWAISEGKRQGVLEFSKRYPQDAANAAGFINYPYSHWEMWDEVGGLGDDCYRFPRGRVIFNANRNKYWIYADRCITEEAIDELVQLYGIEDFELLRDEHYVCPKCAGEHM